LNEYTTSWRRLILNAPIQGSAAEAIKLAAAKVINDCGVAGTSPLRLMVHDELVCEVFADEVEEFSKCLTNAMISASESLHPGIHAGVELGHGHAWSAKI
jgi:DNA polymerase-1